MKTFVLAAALFALFCISSERAYQREVAEERAAMTRRVVFAECGPYGASTTATGLRCNEGDH